MAPKASSLKRKLNSSSSSSKSSSKKGKVVQDGRHRTSGYYGKYNNPNRDDNELKYHDAPINNVLIDNTPEIMVQCNLIPEGTTEKTRIGRKCCLKSIKIDAIMRFTPSATTEGSASCKMALVYDMQANGAAASVADVFTGGDMRICQPQLFNNDRFRILKVWKMNFNCGAHDGTVFGTVEKWWKYYRRLDIPLQFSADTGAITEIKSNNLFIMASTGSSDSDDAINVYGNVRLRFSDKS